MPASQVEGNALGWEEYYVVLAIVFLFHIKFEIRHCYFYFVTFTENLLDCGRQKSERGILAEY